VVKRRAYGPIVTRRAGSLHYTPKKKPRSRGGLRKAQPPGRPRGRPLRPQQPQAALLWGLALCPGFFLGVPGKRPGGSRVWAGVALGVLAVFPFRVRVGWSWSSGPVVSFGRRFRGGPGSFVPVWWGWWSFWPGVWLWWFLVLFGFLAWCCLWALPWVLALPAEWVRRASSLR